MFKIEVQEENGLWHDVRGPDDKILTFEKEQEARAKLAELYPVITQMEKYAGGKRTRVIAIWTDEEDEDWKR
jgi:ABC-type enterochelin transport system substrate-binding protein